MAGISKSFPGVVALDGVDLDVRQGEVHVLLGENGAGKSTLMNVLSGACRKDAGRIWIDDVEVDIAGPHHARELGVSMIYQELALVPALSAAENIFLGRAPRRGWLVDRRAQRTRAQALLHQLDATFDAGRPVTSLSLAERQLVEIARALSLGARILVMDEPTSALSERETRALFSVIRGLAAKGAAIVYISHRLDEIFEIGDRVTVMRDGRHVATRNVTVADRGEFVRLMVNREMDDQVRRSRVALGKELLRVENLDRRGVLHDVSFSVCAGEIVCFAGLMGSGRTEVARAVFGIDGEIRARIFVRGQHRRIRSPRDAIRAGIGFVPEDRKREGLLPGLSIRDNIVLPVLHRVSRLGIVRAVAERALASRFVRELQMRVSSIEQRVLELSGGTQQKVVLARWLASGADVLFLDEPTRGIDVGAKQEVYQLMNRLCAEGKGILLISSVLPEVVGLADRVYVMRGGRVAAEFARADMTAERILACAMGA